MIPIVFFSISLLFSLLMDFFLLRRLAGWPGDDRRVALLLPPMAVCLGALLLMKIEWSLYDDRNWERLFNAFALARGFPIYQDLQSGPVLITLCGPVSAIAFMPAAFAPSPTIAMFTAAVILMGFYFLPPLWLHWTPLPDEPRPDAKNRTYRALLFLIFCFIPFVCKPLRDAAFNIHVDGPTLGLAALACAFLYFRPEKNKNLSLFYSALFAVLSVWSKQVAVPILAALPFYLAVAEGRKTTVRYLFYLAICGILISMVFLVAFNPGRIFFNLITIPSRHGFRNGSSWALGESGLRLAGESALVLVLTAVSLMLLYARAANWKEGIRSWRGSLFLLVSVAMIPVSILGNAKIGGSTNTLSYTIYFLLLAATLGFLNHPPSGFSRRRFLVPLSAMLLCIEIPAAYYRMERSRHQTNYAETVFAYIKKHPGETYFPRLTLLHLMAEGKIYHGITGLLDRRWAGLPLSDEHLRTHLPERLKLIGFRRGTQGDSAELGLTKDQIVPADPELPGFILYQK